MQLFLVPAEHIEHFWPVAAPLLQPAIDYTRGVSSLENEHTAVLTKAKQLWIVGDQEGDKPAFKAAGITSLQKNADGSVTANIEFLGGVGMAEWQHLEPVFDHWAAAEGCRDICIWARKGWLKKLPEFRTTHFIMRKELP